MSDLLKLREQAAKLAGNVDVSAGKEWREKGQRWQLWELNGQGPYRQHLVEGLGAVVVEGMVLAERAEMEPQEEEAGEEEEGEGQVLLTLFVLLTYLCYLRS